MPDFTILAPCLFMPAIIPFIFVGFIILMVVFAIVGYKQRQQRLADLRAFCVARNLNFAEGNNSRMESRFPAFTCLQQGDNRYAYNVMIGAWGQRRITAFDYHYETHSTDSKGHRSTTHHHFSAVVLESNVPLQALALRQENFLDKVTSFFGYDDIDFESAQFSREFFVRAPDKKWAYDVIHQRTMEFLLSQPRFSMQFDTQYVMAWRSSTFKPEEFAQAAHVIAGVLDRLPAYLIQQQTSQSPA